MVGKVWGITSQQLLGKISSSIATRKVTVSVITSPLHGTVSALAVQQFLALRQYWCQRIQKRIRDIFDSPKYPEPKYINLKKKKEKKESFKALLLQIIHAAFREQGKRLGCILAPSCLLQSMLVGCWVVTDGLPCATSSFQLSRTSKPCKVSCSWTLNRVISDPLSFAALSNSP